MKANNYYDNIAIPIYVLLSNIETL